MTDATSVIRIEGELYSVTCSCDLIFSSIEGYNAHECWSHMPDVNRMIIEFGYPIFRLDEDV